MTCFVAAVAAVVVVLLEALVDDDPVALKAEYVLAPKQDAVFVP
jgi:hypothetical protein